MLEVTITMVPTEGDLIPMSNVVDVFFTVYCFNKFWRDTLSGTSTSATLMGIPFSDKQK